MSGVVRAADSVTADLASYGLAGAILAVLVAPVLYVLVRSSQKREEDRGRMDAEETRRRGEREDKLLNALVASVAQQKEALELRRVYETSEERVHSTILSGIQQITVTQENIARTLADVASMLSRQKASP